MEDKNIGVGQTQEREKYVFSLVLFIVALGAIVSVAYILMNSREVTSSNENVPTVTPTEAPTTNQPNGELEIDVNPQSNQRTYTLNPQNNSGETGAVLVDTDGESTYVSISMSNSDPSLSAAIYNGTCVSPGEAAHTLNPVNFGQSDTVIDVPMSEILAGNYVLDIRETAANPQTSLACTDFE